MHTPATTPTATVADFTDSFDELWAVAYRVAFRVLGDRSDAEDIAQETLERVYGRWSRGGHDTAGFAAHVAGHRAIDLWRKRQRRPVMRGEVASGPPGLVEERSALVRALTTLPKRQQETIVLRYLADLSERDTARAMNCTVGTVKQQTSRGLSALRAELETRPSEV